MRLADCGLRHRIARDDGAGIVHLEFELELRIDVKRAKAVELLTGKPASGDP
jgi:hypothetical protein